MTCHERKARELIKEHGRVQAKQFVINKIQALKKELQKANSIYQGIDRSNDIADQETILKLISKV